MAAIAWSTIRAALVTWLQGSSATSLGAGKVLWAGQNGVQVQGDHATLRIASVTSLGLRDEVQPSTDLGRPAGEEVALTAKAQREFIVSVQVITAKPVDGAGTSDAMALASKARDSLALGSVCAAFDAAGFCVVDPGQLLDVGAVLDSEFLGRAAFDLRCRTAGEVAEYTGYIATVELIDDLNGYVD